MRKQEPTPRRLRSTLSVGLDPRIGPQYLKSGLGFGGSCFKKDILSLIYLAQLLGLPEVGEYWQQVLTLNDFQRNCFACRVIQRLNNTLVHKKITLLGYSFKKNTSDTRESPAADVIKTFLNDGPAEIAIFDPCCNPETAKEEIQRLLGSAEERLLKSEGGPVKAYTDVYSACRNSNAVVILTEWDEFRDLLKNTVGSKLSKAHKTPLPDPRPFQTPEPSESDLLALHRYLSSQTSQLAKTTTAIPTPSLTPKIEPKPDTSNSLNRYAPEPACLETCSEYARESPAYSKASEQLDWVRIAAQLKAPKWILMVGASLMSLRWRIWALESKLSGRRAGRGNKSMNNKSRMTMIW